MFCLQSYCSSSGSCPVRKGPHQVAKYIGSAAPRLGFYHLETTYLGVNSIGIMKNCEIVHVEIGVIKKEELAQEFSIIYKTNWP